MARRRGAKFRGLLVRPRCGPRDPGWSTCELRANAEAPAPGPGARTTRAVIRFVRSTPADRAASALNSGDSWISFRVPPVQSETGRERNYQNQNQRFDAHANAPVACWRHGSTKSAPQFDPTKIFAERCKNPTDRPVTNTAIPRPEQSSRWSRAFAHLDAWTNRAGADASTPGNSPKVGDTACALA